MNDAYAPVQSTQVTRARAHGTSAPSPAATNAPSGIGSLEASVGILEAEKLLSGESEHALVGRELYLDARHHQFYVTRLTRNPRCLFDHQTWTVSEVGAVTLGEALGLGGAPPSVSELAVEGDAFAGELSCPACRRKWAAWKLRSRLAEERPACAGCERPLIPSGSDQVERLSAKWVNAELLRRPLRDFGLRPGDIFSIRACGGETHYQIALEAPARPRSGATVVLAGCGNIGSHLAPHLARIPGVGRVVLVDHDEYEDKNLAGQDIRAADSGRPKVEVQAERLRQIRPDLEVIAVAERLEALPLAHFRNALLLGALDSRGARQQLNQIAWRVGSPWIDMAVDGAGLLCRTTVYQPGVDSPCLECGWDEGDYRLLFQTLPCKEIAATQGRETGGR
jgi:hypothetical protein